MPRKAKEKDVELNNKIDEKKTAKTTKKTIATKKETTTKKSATVKTTTKKSSSSAKTDSKKDTKITKSTKTVETKPAIKSKPKKVQPIVEYYDLPFRYNQTVVKILAQTPNVLFIYWDISDEDRENYKKQYGENFFDITKPVLIVYNDTLGYNFEVEINDFANSWYLHVADSKCDYRIELGRRPIINNDKLNTDYIFISNSNEIESPNDKILFNKQQKMIYFRNTKTNKETQKSINNISFLTNMGKIYDIYDLYKLIYKNENVEEIYNTSNPSSGNPSSHF